MDKLSTDFEKAKKDKAQISSSNSILEETLSSKDAKLKELIDSNEALKKQVDWYYNNS